MKSSITLVIAAMIMVGCGKKEEVRSDAPRPAAVQQQDLMKPDTPIPDRPAPDVPKGAVPDYPKPGQTNNHSSPAFNSGGAAPGK